jgi:hypothetical protein
MTDSLTTSTSRHRPTPLQLPDDPRAAAALALAVIRGDDTFCRAQAIEGLTARIAKLVDAGSAESLEELTAQLPILNELFLRFSIDAISTGMTINKSSLVRMALAAQTSYGRTVALIAGLKLQREGKASVSVQDAQDVL